MLAEGPVRIVLSYKEPMKDVLWMRPFLGKDGYDLLYYGANGWTKWCLCIDQDILPTIKEDRPEEDKTENDGRQKECFTNTIPCGCNRQ